MTNKNLEIAKHLIDAQRMSSEKKYVLKEHINKAIKEAEDDVKREMKKKIEDLQYEHEQQLKVMMKNQDLVQHLIQYLDYH